MNEKRFRWEKINYKFQLKILSVISLVKVAVSFYKLKNYIFRFNPVSLISQLTLTFLVVPENEYLPDGSIASKWARWIELLSGLLLSRKQSKKKHYVLSGEKIEQIEKLVSEYFTNIHLYLISSSKRKTNSHDTNSIIEHAKLYSLSVRGESYPHLLKNMAEDLYSNFDDWFLNKLGFAIKNAITITNAIIDELSERIIRNRKQIKTEVEKKIDRQGKIKKLSKKEARKIEEILGCYGFFNLAPSMFTYSLEDIVRISGLSEEICNHFLNRMSQPYKYRNPKYKKIFVNPLRAPWDYVALYEKPILRFENKYFVPLMHIIPEVLFTTFYYDLICDEDYWGHRGKDIYGSWLENKTFESLCNVFPSQEVFLRPRYQNQEELCDVLVLHDRYIYIIQCKTKKMQYESRNGMNFNKIKDDLEKGVKDSFSQAEKAKNYILQNAHPIILTPHGGLNIDSSQISKIILMSVTLTDYQNLTTRIANINPAIQLFSDNQYPWCISLFDLLILTEILEDPYSFIQYTRRRLLIEQTKFNIFADEIDLLGFFLKQGLYFDEEEFNSINALTLSGCSDKIDRYFFEKYVCKIPTEKPMRMKVAKYEKFLDAIKALDIPYKTDCVIRIMDMCEEGSNKLIDEIIKLRNKAKKDHKLHSISTVMNNNEFGISYIAMDSKGDTNALIQQTLSFATLKKYATKCKEWVGLGSNIISNKLLDFVLFLSYDELPDEVLDKLAKETLKPGMYRSFVK